MTDKVLMPKELTAENGAKYIFMGEFSVLTEINCTECGFIEMQEAGIDHDEECDICDGSGVYEQKITIDWTTIKDIYKMAVDKLGESK
jgi:hypothetical protein